MQWLQARWPQRLLSATHQPTHAPARFDLAKQFMRDPVVHFEIERFQSRLCVSVGAKGVHEEGSGGHGARWGNGRRWRGDGSGSGGLCVCAPEIP